MGLLWAIIAASWSHLPFSHIPPKSTCSSEFWSWPSVLHCLSCLHTDQGVEPKLLWMFPTGTESALVFFQHRSTLLTRPMLQPSVWCSPCPPLSLLGLPWTTLPHPRILLQRCLRHEMPCTPPVFCSHRALHVPDDTQPPLWSLFQLNI